MTDESHQASVEDIGVVGQMQMLVHDSQQTAACCFGLSGHQEASYQGLCVKLLSISDCLPQSTNLRSAAM